MTAEQDLERAVKAHLGSHCTVHPVQAWDGSIVLEVQHQGERSFVKAHRRTSILPEAWALGAARDAGASVPLVRHIGTVDLGGSPMDWMLLEAIEGSPWALPEDLRQIDTEVYRWIGHQLRQLHQVTSPTAGTFDAKGRTEGASWSAWLLATAAESFESLGFPDYGFRGRLLALIARRAELLDSRPIVLVHGDLGNREILLDLHGSPVGLVDLRNALFGDPIWDLAMFMGGGLPDDPRPVYMLPALVEAYCTGTGPPQDLRWLWTLYGVFNDLHNIRWSQREGLDDWVDPLWANLRTGILHLELPS